MSFADVGDIVEAAPSETLLLHIQGDFADQLSEGDVENLVLRAARALAAAAGVEQGAALTLEKNLPVASGIGGGSADAAATFRATHLGMVAEPLADRLASAPDRAPYLALAARALAARALAGTRGSRQR